jgi:hypothetical protein
MHSPAIAAVARNSEAGAAQSLPASQQLSAKRQAALARRRCARPKKALDDGRWRAPPLQAADGLDGAIPLRSTAAAAERRSSRRETAVWPQSDPALPNARRGPWRRSPFPSCADRPASMRGGRLVALGATVRSAPNV